MRLAIVYIENDVAYNMLGQGCAGRFVQLDGAAVQLQYAVKTLGKYRAIPGDNARIGEQRGNALEIASIDTLGIRVDQLLYLA